jgi:uncharacterized damage-inducible protein DinB
MKELLDRYVAGGRQLRESIAGLSPEQLKAFPVPGTWSIQQIVIHMLDSDLIGADRMKRVAAEDREPTLIGYDESAFARELSYHELDPQKAIEVFDLNRQLTAESLRRLPAQRWDRIGHHNEHPRPLSLRDLLATYVGHLEHHLKFIAQKRAMMERQV